MRRALIFAIAIVCAVGCSTGSDYTQASSTKPPEAPPPAVTPTGHEPTANPSDAKLLEQDEKAYIAAKADYAKKPESASKQKLVAATVKFGTDTMMAETLGPKVKYKKALQLYREALKLDPTNAEAKGNADMIVKIYKDMGRPVP